MPRNMVCLVKFGAKEHVERFSDTGEMFIRRLFGFRGIEKSEVGDKNENLLSSLQSSRLDVKWGPLDLTEGLVGQVKITSFGINPFVYCMYGITTDHEFKNGSHIDLRCKDFGDSAFLIKDVQEFYNRVQRYCRSNKINSIGKMVEYVNEHEHHGRMGPFKKYYSNYGHQSEFRMAFEIESEMETETIHIGCLKDIGFITDIDEINKELKVNA